MNKWVDDLFLTKEEIKRRNEMYKKVHFIGSGYESIKKVIVEATTNGEAIDKAIALYKENGWNFHYNEIVVDRCL